LPLHFCICFAFCLCKSKGKGLSKGKIKGLRRLEQRVRGAKAGNRATEKNVKKCKKINYKNNYIDCLNCFLFLKPSLDSLGLFTFALPLLCLCFASSFAFAQAKGKANAKGKGLRQKKKSS